MNKIISTVPLFLLLIYYDILSIRLNVSKYNLIVNIILNLEKNNSIFL